MSIESIAAAGAAAVPQPPTQTVQAGYGASLQDFTGFQSSMVSAAQRMGGGQVASTSPAMKSAFGALESINGEAKAVGDYAKSVQASGKEMKPSEVIQLTMRCQEFMFHCQLSSNIANRTSDGLQQMFRQQS